MFFGSIFGVIDAGEQFYAIPHADVLLHFVVVGYEPTAVGLLGTYAIQNKLE
jgi:hypothetical protein